MHLVHWAADRSYVQPLNQRHNATNFGIPEFGSLKFSEFSNSQNQSIMEWLSYWQAYFANQASSCKMQ